MFLELLTEKDKQLINHLREYGVDTQDYYITYDNIVDCDYFLRFWEQAKAASLLKHIFKNELIIKKRVNITMENDVLYNKINHLRNTDAFVYIKNSIYEMLKRKNDILAFSTDCITIFSSLENHFFSDEALVSNRYNGPTLELILPNSKTFKLSQGCKTMKALGRLAEEANVGREFETIRILQSQALNEAYISATLCLSIHPLDYITASFNNCGWDSCMDWEDGDYRRGVIEMMNSKYVMVAYLESDSQKMDFKINNDETAYWNSKRWREFFIVSDKGIFGVKGYPYWNHKLEDVVLKFIRELLVQDGQNQYSNPIITWNFDRQNPHPHFSCGPAMYNDFYDGNDYHAIIVGNSLEDFFLHYSGESECIVCGQVGDFEEEGADLICEECHRPSHCCAECGDPIWEEDAYTFEDQEYCHFCYYHVLPRCSCCDELISQYKPSFEFVIGNIKDNHITTLLTDHLDRPIAFGICDKCSDEIFVEEKEYNKDHLKFRHLYSPLYNVVHYKQIKDLTQLDIYNDCIEKFIKNISEEKE